MKITHDTPDTLIIDYRPFLIALLLCAMLLGTLGGSVALFMTEGMAGFILLGFSAMVALFIVIFVRRVQLVFHRPEGWLEIRRQSFLGRRTVRHRLDEVSHAEVESARSSKGGDTHRPVLIFPEGQSAGRHPVTLYYVSGKSAERACRAINRWLENAPPA